jgi:hypothetical protein
VESVHRVAQGRRGHIKRAIGRNKATLRSVKPDPVSAFAMSRDNLHRLLDSSLRDVKQDDSNNEVAPSRGGEQIDDVLDGFVGAVVGGFKLAVWAILRVRTAVEAAVGKWSAQPFVEQQKKQCDLNTL